MKRTTAPTPSAKRQETIELFGGDIAYSQSTDRTISITVRGTVAENLHRAADAMNGVGWCCGDNTAASVLAEFVGPMSLEEWHDTPPFHDFIGLGGQLAQIATAIDTGAADDDEDTKKREELRAALYKAFNVKELEITA